MLFVPAVNRQLALRDDFLRNQLVLDLANPEVQNFVFGVVDNIMKENPEMAFLKWDCNAPIFNGHSEYLSKKKIPQSHLYVEYSKGLLNVLEKVRAKYPQVSMMLCSGGAGRSDYGLLKYFTEFWLSDDTDPLERVFIQWDFSYYYPSITMCNHVTNWSNKPLKYRIDVQQFLALILVVGCDFLLCIGEQRCHKAALRVDHCLYVRLELVKHLVVAFGNRTGYDERRAGVVDKH